MSESLNPNLKLQNICSPMDKQVPPFQDPVGSACNERGRPRMDPARIKVHRLLKKENGPWPYNRIYNYYNPIRECRVQCISFITEGIVHIIEDSLQSSAVILSW
jgi:hypothetical protein